MRALEEKYKPIRPNRHEEHTTQQQQSTRSSQVHMVISNRQKTRKFTNTWKLNHTVLNNK